MPFKDGFDINSWGLLEYVTAIIILLLIFILILILVPKKKKQNVSYKEVKVDKKSIDEDDTKPTSKPVVQSNEEATVIEQVKDPEVTVEKNSNTVTNKDNTKNIDDNLSTKEDSKIDKPKPAKVLKYHVSLNKDENSEFSGQWRVRKEGSKKTIKYFKTQVEAIKYAQDLADSNNTSVVIHKKDGSIRKQDYSNKSSK
ncbi:DUF2188 domain-containing protein [Acholeplasma granularum]|uniref:DUF2188 domain-containing protein n=1 Tax=Acholeplasma granularum TaxID=264635 RepID=UPI00046E627F|nr:DUF2188 domain-containing protein [Acholeplasma granularum]